MLQENHTNKHKRLFILYVAAYVVIKINFIYSGHDLFSEESQYWLWSRHLDWSYYSKPPLIAWINFITGLLFAHSDHVIRFTALFCGFATMVVFYAAALELFSSQRIALMATVILSLSPFFLLASTFFTTDTLLLFFWTLTFYLFLKGIHGNYRFIWPGIGAAFGLGCLSKYTMVFFVLVLMVPFLWKIDKSAYVRRLLIMSGVAFFLILPVIWWNYQHDWISIKHVNNLATGTSIQFDFIKSLRYAGEFAGGVILINSPFFAIIFFKGLNQKYKSYPHPEKQKLGLLLIPVAGTVLFFFILSFFDSVEVNWPSMAYLFLPLAIAYFIVTHQYTCLFVVSSSITATLLFLLLFPVLLDKTGMSSLVPIKSDGLKRMAGWKELSEKVMEVKNNYQAEDCVFVFSSSYHIASSVSFYMNTDKVLCIDINRRKNQFDLWENINKYENTSCYGIYISDPPISQALIQSFENQIIVVNVPVHYRGHLVRNFNIYVFKNFHGWHLQSPASSY